MATTETDNGRVDFKDQDQNRNRMKMEDMDPNLGIICLKEETQEYSNQVCTEQVKNQPKEEHQDPDSLEQAEYKIEIKEEDHGSDFMNQDHRSAKMKEENQDPDLPILDPAGSTDHQVKKTGVRRVRVLPAGSGLRENLETVKQKFFLGVSRVINEHCLYVVHYWSRKHEFLCALLQHMCWDGLEFREV